MSRHFNRNGHQGMDDVEIYILDFVHQATAKSSTTDIRLGLEFDWIHRLHCLIPKGLNSLDGSYQQSKPYEDIYVLEDIWLSPPS